MLKVSRILTAKSSLPLFDHESLEQYSTTGPRDKLIEMGIDDFLRLASDFAVGPDKESLDRIRKSLDQGEFLKEIPFLSVKPDPNGKAVVTGHEGRHRALVLKERGYTTMPVLLRSEGEIYSGAGIVWSRLNQPDHWDHYKGAWPEVLEGQDKRKNTIEFPVKKEQGALPFGNMLKVSRILEASSYGGGWFLPNGKVLRGGSSYSHAGLANEYLKRGNWAPLGSGPSNPIRDGEYGDLFRNGWIRLWFDEQGLCIETTTENWTTSDFQRVQEYVMANPETLGGKPDVYIEVGRTIHVDRDTFLTANKPTDLYRDLSKVSRLLTANTNVFGWLLPDGSYHEVDTIYHVQWACRYLGIEYRLGSATDYGYFLRLGWIRMVRDGAFAENWSPKNLHRLQEFLMSMQISTGKYHLEWMSPSQYDHDDEESIITTIEELLVVNRMSELRKFN